MTLKPLFAAAALALAAGAAPALTITLSPTGPGTSAGLFTQAVDGLFVDSFEFLPGSFSGQVSVSLLGVSGPVSFFAATLNEQDFPYLPELGAPTFSFSTQVSNTTPLSLTVFGGVLDGDGNPAGPGIYTVSVNAIAAVPEPASAALLLAGLAGVALMARRRQRSRSSV